MSERWDDVVLEQTLVEIDSARPQVRASVQPSARRRRARPGPLQDRSRFPREVVLARREPAARLGFRRKAARGPVADSVRRRVARLVTPGGQLADRAERSGACSSFGSPAVRRNEAPQRRDPEPGPREIRELRSGSTLDTGYDSPRAGIRAATIQAATSSGSKRTNRPTLT